MDYYTQGQFDEELTGAVHALFELVFTGNGLWHPLHVVMIMVAFWVFIAVKYLNHDG